MSVVDKTMEKLIINKIKSSAKDVKASEVKHYLEQYTDLIRPVLTDWIKTQYVRVDDLTVSPESKQKMKLMLREDLSIILNDIKQLLDDVNILVKKVETLEK